MSRLRHEPSRGKRQRVAVSLCPVCSNSILDSKMQAHVESCFSFFTAKTPPKKSKNPGQKRKKTGNDPQSLFHGDNHQGQALQHASQNNGDDGNGYHSSETIPMKPIARPVPLNSKFKDIPDAPVFRPQPHEFDDPIRYIQSIRPIAEQYGICRIIPPDGWKPKDFKSPITRKTDFLFETKVQNIHQLQSRAEGNDMFMLNLRSVNPLLPVTLPRYRGLPLEQLLGSIFFVVSARGGSDQVSYQETWDDVAAAVGLDGNVPKMKITDGNNDSNNDNIDVVNVNSSNKDLDSLTLVALYKLYLKDYEQHTKQPKMKVRERPTAPSVSSSSTSVASKGGKSRPARNLSGGFAVGDTYTMQRFRRLAHQFKQSWYYGVAAEKGNVTIAPEVVESAFWQLVENPPPTEKVAMKVHYGSDLDVATHGSGFPPYGDIASRLTSLKAQGWNPNALPLLRGSVLKYLPERISGVTIPMMYVGMVFSCFCWHNEDNYMYSTSFLHEGDPKTWYGVPGSKAGLFERVMRAALPDLFEENPDLLHCLITMLTPTLLLSNGVPVCRTVQRPGEFVVTFPQAYHAGFNHGFNCAEAVNFATADWLPFGRKALDRYRSFRRKSVFDHYRLVCRIALETTDPKVAEVVTSELKVIRDEELALREGIAKAGVGGFVRWSAISYDSEHMCSTCMSDCFFSCVACSCTPCENRISCLSHIQEMCKCSYKEKCILVRYTIEEMNELIETVKKRFPNADRPVF
eukprot:TRINITY_DN1754_c0_g4_i1.p1 TRINITY_DN1754_c0_g4~~TRINITY_DN1754_c0_g4_i1.p1  ORF type:complete len:743 (-),score=124.96 TRINITY_DN1754_c0_g4_i1:71-2299(-)